VSDQLQALAGQIAAVEILQEFFPCLLALTRITEKPV